MTSHLVTNIAELVTNDPTAGDGDLLGIVHDAAVVVEDGRIAWVGAASQAPEADRRTDVAGRAVIPGFVDSHSHLVFDGDRAAEFAARLTGQPYDGGGIATTVAATRAASDELLRELLRERVAEMRAQGTTLVEVKSGYGLDVESEARLLRLAGEVTDETTYLGAHVVPAGAGRQEYVDLVCGEMMQACAPHARWVDVFCEPHSAHAFTGEETEQILRAGTAAGLLPRLHAGQLGLGPGVQLAVDFGAASVDHCTYLSEADVEALAGSDTVATLLPGVEFSTRSPFPNGGALWEAGVTVALASDCNPGTCYSSSMPFMVALAAREMNMTPAQALWGATQGGARALRRDDVGAVKVGMRADLAVLDAPSHLHLCYRPGVPIAHALELEDMA
ncbi:imidazolonepropionase [Amycolatopsis sp. H6(2020)]|nr:imidazolonepropionase [Amycolatopsis sp. H6(2020)]